MFRSSLINYFAVAFFAVSNQSVSIFWMRLNFIQMKCRLSINVYLFTVIFITHTSLYIFVKILRSYLAKTSVREQKTKLNKLKNHKQPKCFIYLIIIDFERALFEASEREKKKKITKTFECMLSEFVNV